MKNSKCCQNSYIPSKIDLETTADYLLQKLEIYDFIEDPSGKKNSQCREYYEKLKNIEGIEHTIQYLQLLLDRIYYVHFQCILELRNRATKSVL